MQVLLTTKGTPYIEVDESTKLIFSKSTAHKEKGYKFLVISSCKTQSLCISGAKAKKKRYVEQKEDNSCTVRLKDFKRSDTAAFPKGIVSPITLKVLKRLIMENVGDDGYFPYHRIEALNDDLVKTFDDPDQYVDDDPTATKSYDSVETVKKPKKREKVKIRLKSKPKIKSSIRLKKKK